MQTVISNLAHSFIDDAIALVRGFANVGRNLVSSGIAGVHVNLAAPIDRLARRCDVAGVLPPAPPHRKRFDLLSRLNPFRGLRELT